MPRRRAALETTWLLVGLATVALARAAVNGNTSLTAFASGTGFAAVLVALALAAGWRPSMPRIRALVLGVAAGGVLVVLPRVVHPLLPSVIGMRPEPLVAWSLVTAAVAVGEEVLLRGALFDALGRAGGVGAGGVGAAVIVTSLAF
ncbi:MAG: hypothetical protein ABI978_00170, partial [Chloroflexota bacterium]